MNHSKGTRTGLIYVSTYHDLARSIFMQAHHFSKNQDPFLYNQDTMFLQN